MAVSIEGASPEERKEMLQKCAATTLSSKLVGGEKDFFAKMVVDAVTTLDHDVPLNMIGVKKVQGGTMRDSFLVEGVAFKKTFSYAGFEQQPKQLTSPKILLLNIELELKSEKENAEVRLKDPGEYQSIVDAEWNIIYDKLDKCVASGASIVLSRLAIGDLATQVNLHPYQSNGRKRKGVERPSDPDPGHPSPPPAVLCGPSDLLCGSSGG